MFNSSSISSKLISGASSAVADNPTLLGSGKNKMKIVNYMYKTSATKVSSHYGKTSTQMQKKSVRLEIAVPL